MSAKHLYRLDIPHMKANDGATRCADCHEAHDHASHARHRRNCKDRYGSGTPGCEGCDARAAQIRATGCTLDPYAATCGHAFADTPTCICGRQQSTD